jgi:hypothetical protein
VTDYDVKGTKERIACSYKSLPSSVKVGSVSAILSITVFLFYLRGGSCSIQGLCQGWLGKSNFVHRFLCNLILVAVAITYNPLPTSVKVGSVCC